MNSYRSTHSFIPYALQEIDEEDVEAIKKAAKGEMITRFVDTDAFEESFGKAVDAPFSVAFSSGSTALWATALVLSLNRSDRIYTTPNTYISSAGSFTREGAELELVDIDPKNGNVSLEKLVEKISWKRTRGRAIYVPVHFGGTPFDVKSFDDHLDDPDSVIIEDAAHAIGSTYPDGTKVGSCAFSDMTIFSFHASKTITTGEGGMVTTYSKELYELLKRVRNNGSERTNTLYPGYYFCHETTSNLHMSELQAALGLSQLKKLDRFVAKRKLLLKTYHKLLKGLPQVIPLVTAEGTAPHLSVVRIDFKSLKKERKEVMEALKDKGIGTQVHYPPLYHHLPYQNQPPLEEMESYFSECLSLPLFTQLEEEDIDYIVRSLKEVLGLV